MKRLVFLLNIFLIISLTSCARPPVRHTYGLHTIPTPGRISTVPDALRTDVYHEVAPGETAWRISKMYDVKLQDIVRANRLNDPAALEKGQKLLIPDAAPLKSIITFWPSKKWKYVIIHHSATDVGNALSFDNVHSKKRRWKGLGYHFVIDNGSSGKKDGHIEASPRWIHKEDGAHCKADNMNYKSIGICLVGNFSTDDVTPEQMSSLIWLVNELKKRYHISNSRILGHGQVKGAITECPGKRFPWPEFRRRLNP